MPGISNKSEFGYVSLNSGVVTIRIGENRGVVSLDLNVIESLAVIVLKDRVYNTQGFQISEIAASHFCGKMIQSFNAARNAGWLIVSTIELAVVGAILLALYNYAPSVARAFGHGQHQVHALVGARKPYRRAAQVITYIPTKR